MESNKWETEEKEINMTQAEYDRISERWMRITSAIKNAVEQEHGGIYLSGIHCRI